MLFDTDIFIWAQRGNLKAAKSFEKATLRYLSVQTYMELLQCARKKEHHLLVKDFLVEFDFEILPLTENIGHRAAIYMKNMGYLLAFWQAVPLLRQRPQKSPGVDDE